MVEKNLYDPSEFEPNSILDDEIDPWFAFQMPYFWSILLPKLQESWKYNDLQGIIDMKYKVSVFPYTEKEVMTAFLKFSDALGPILKKRIGVFKKCSCMKDGVRRPCVPPRVGYMCRRNCTFLKMKLVFQTDRQDRLWNEYKKNNLSDAVKRAKNEAEIYLNSKEGKTWLSTEAFEQSNLTLLVQDGVGKKKGWRLRLANKRKKKIMKKFNRKILETEKERDDNEVRMQAELLILKNRLNGDDMVKGGFLYIKTETTIQNLIMRLGNMEEDVRLQRLMLMSELECDKIDDFIYEQGDEYSSESEEELSDSSIEPDSDDSEDHEKVMKKENILRMKEEILDRTYTRKETARTIKLAAKRARSFAPHDSIDRTLVRTDRQSYVDRTVDASKAVGVIAVKGLEKIKNKIESEMDKGGETGDESQGEREGDVDRGERMRQKDSLRAMRKKFRRVKDIAEARMKRFLRLVDEYTILILLLILCSFVVNF